METRLYIFSHFSFSDITKGIQGLHSTVELINYYKDFEGHKLQKMVDQWMSVDKTTIMLNGGFSISLNETLILLKDSRNTEYPFYEFREDPETLEGILTSVSLILPEKIWLTKDFLRKGIIEFNDNKMNFIKEISDEDKELLKSYGTFTEYDIILMNHMNRFRLA